MTSACQTTSPGYGRRWFANYENAEAKSNESGEAMVIWYKEARPGIPDPLRDTFRDATIRRRLRNYVACSLLRSYEPDRRYVAQYGVVRAPAIIVVRTDGTYHAQVGRQSVEQVHELLNRAVAPGSPPSLDPHIPRKARYHWLDDFGAASAEAFRTKQSILVVFHRWLSRDRERMDKILERPEVFRRTAELIPCRLSMRDNANRALAQRFGIRELPALVLINAHGDYGVLELPTSYESVVRFADEWRDQDPIDPVEAGPAAASFDDGIRAAPSPAQATPAPAQAGTH